MKATLSEIKKNPLGSNSEGKEAGVQVSDLEHKEEMNSQPVQNEETRIQKKKKKEKKNEERIKILGYRQTCQHPNHRGSRRTITDHSSEKFSESKLGALSAS